MNNQLLRQISILYKLSSVVFKEKVSAGYLSNNYILQDGDQKYFLKQYRYNEEQKIKEVHQVKLFFHRNGIPIILPITNIEGNTYFSLDHNFYSLFPYIEGKIIERGDFSEKALTNLGTMLARIHLLSKKDFPQIFKRAERFSKEKFHLKYNGIFPIIEQVKNFSSFDQMAYESILLKKQLVDANTITDQQLDVPFNHLIHGDYQNQNIFFDNHDNITHVFDVEKTEIAPRILEVVRSMDYMCFNGDFKESNYDNGRIYLNAYRDVYPISEDELKNGITMYYLTKIHSLWIETEHYMNKSTRVDVFLSNQLNTIKYFMNSKDHFTNSLNAI